MTILGGDLVAYDNLPKIKPGEASSATSFACGCIGPQNGQPLCPCQMRSITIKDGRYVRIQDFGPAPTGAI
jgi:hypothetical protein